MIKILLNPFDKYREIPLLAFGVVMMVTGSLAAWYFSGRYDGVIDFHISEEVQIHEPFTDNLINTLSLFLFVFIAAKSINNKTRIIDVLNAALIARIPFYLLTLTNAGNFISNITANIDPAHPEKIMNNVPALIFLLMFAGLTIAILLWFVILLYNGFKTFCNAKGNSHKLYFALAIIAAEVLSKFLIYTIS